MPIYPDSMKRIAQFAQEIREPQQGDGPGNPGGLRVVQQWVDETNEVEGLSKYSNGAFAKWNSDGNTVDVLTPFGQPITWFDITMLEDNSYDTDTQAYRDAFMRDHDAMMEYMEPLPDDLRVTFHVGE